MLVAAGASLTMRDANGLTPMMIAFQVEDNDLATYLESKCHTHTLFCHYIILQFYPFVIFSCFFGVRVRVYAHVIKSLLGQEYPLHQQNLNERTFTHHSVHAYKLCDTIRASIA